MTVRRRPPPNSSTLPRTSPWFFWACVAVGTTMILFGLHSVQRTRSTPIYWVVRWMAGLLVVHDGLITIAVGMAGWALARWLPDWLSGPVRGALALSTIVVVFSLPLWQRRGINPSNPSRLPLNYASAVLTVLAAVWCVSASRGRVAVAGPAGTPLTSGLAAEPTGSATRRR